MKEIVLFIVLGFIAYCSFMACVRSKNHNKRIRRLEGYIDEIEEVGAGCKGGYCGPGLADFKEELTEKLKQKEIENESD